MGAKSRVVRLLDTIVRVCDEQRSRYGNNETHMAAIRDFAMGALDEIRRKEIRGKQRRIAKAKAK